MYVSPPIQSIKALLVLLAASIGIVGVAHGFEHFGNYRPCPLCLMQRYPYYVAIAAAAVGLLGVRRGWGSGWVRALLVLIALGYLINTGLGAYHAGVEWKWWAGPNTCTAVLPKLSTGAALDLSQPVIRCDAAPWVFAGLSFAGWNAVLSAGLAVLALYGYWPRRITRTSGQRG
jgi:disulfide bond formation protein DsbB